LLLLSGAVALTVLALRHYAERIDAEIVFESTAVRRGDVLSTVSASGVLSPLVTVQIGSQVSGRISELLVDFNSVVKKGDVLARIDPEPLQADLERAEADVDAARAALTEAKALATEAERSAKRSTQLAERSLIAIAEAESAQASAEVARARVESARARLKQSQAARDKAQASLDYTTILSPIDGVVISRSVDAGQTVAASLQAPTLFLIAEDLRRMQVDAAISESDVGKLRDGMKASFSVDAFPQETYEGTLRQIRNSPVTVQNVVTYSAIIDVDNPKLQLRPGMTANVSFIVDARRDVLVVSNAALRFKPVEGMQCESNPEKGEAAGTRKGKGERGAKQGRRTGKRPAEQNASKSRIVWRLQDGKAECLSVQVGLSDGSVTELIGPVQEGDALVTAAENPQATAAPRNTRSGRMF
jgi:HlyD family secretion protein